MGARTAPERLIWTAWGHNLRKARERSHLTQTTLAELIGIPQSDLSRYENGRAPSDRVKIRFARFYGCGLNDLFPWPTFLPPEPGEW